MLGDRFRLASDALDEGVFVRSLAAPSGQESVAQHLPVMVEILARFGFDVILIETVGAGQGDVAVREWRIARCCCFSQNRATISSGKKPAFWKWPTSS